MRKRDCWRGKFLLMMLRSGGRGQPQFCTRTALFERGNRLPPTQIKFGYQRKNSTLQSQRCPWSQRHNKKYLGREGGGGTFSPCSRHSLSLLHFYLSVFSQSFVLYLIFCQFWSTLFCWPISCPVDLMIASMHPCLRSCA